jgi:hypothetical protein
MCYNGNCYDFADYSDEGDKTNSRQTDECVDNLKYIIVYNGRVYGKVG